jgi:glutamyl-tRNA synthetase
MDERIEAHALLNARKYGQAQPGNVLPKIIGEFPDAKKDIPALRARIDAIVAKVNAMARDTQEARLEQIGHDLLEKPKQKERDLPELEHAHRGKVVTRIPPEPSKYNHLGHALTFLINSTYAQRYEGKVILRFEDANPEKVAQEYVDAMLEDIQGYLGIRPDAIRYVSDDMPQLLAYAEELIRKGAAYMCFCDRETIGKNREEGKECACRKHSHERNLSEWHNFVKGEYMDGQCVLRFAGDMQSKNTTLRDPVLFRAVRAEHFRKGTQHKVWPLYDFYNPIEEHLCGVTHVIRSNEFDLRIELQQRLQRALGLPEPHIVHYGRFNIKDATTKGREIRDLIESGAYIGWDDPRLMTLKALRRRGIRKEAYELLVRQLGLSPYPVTLDFSMLAALNRQLVEPTAKRYSFVPDPVEIGVEGAPHEDVELHLHPTEKKGGRHMRVAGAYYVRRSDAERFGEDRPIRLKDYLTIRRAGDGYASLGHDVPKEKGFFNVNWVSALPGQHVPVEVMMPDATVAKGVAERGIAALEVDEIIQFERFGFCRLDRVEGGTHHFWYAHD